MSDLISRSALIEKLEHEIKLTESYIRQDEQRNFSSDYISLNAQLNTRLSIKKIVEDMPTAYELDKVLNRIRDYFVAECDARTEGMEECPAGYINDLLKHNKVIRNIVRKGGTEPVTQEPKPDWKKAFLRTFLGRN